MSDRGTYSPPSAYTAIPAETAAASPLPFCAAVASTSEERLPPPGARVRLRGESWSVVGHGRYDDCIALRLDAAPDRLSRTFLLPFDRVAPMGDRRLHIVSPRTWLRVFGAAAAGTYPLGGLRHAPSGIDLLPFQLEPALAVLRHGHPRLLIADDVGMGKTIEAAIVLRELSARADGFRALILVPAGLREQWRAELRGKFALEATIADAAWLRDSSRTLPPDINPWSPPGTYIASFDFVKRPEALRGLESERWDVVVIDEAHACTAPTDRRVAADAVARRAARVLLLTATPPTTAADLEGLARIGAAGGAPAPMLRRRREPAPQAKRSSVLLAVRPMDLERKMHRLLERYTQLLWLGSAGAAPQRLLGTVLRKRALSSAASLSRSLRRRQDLLAGRFTAGSLQLLLPLGGLEEDPLDDCVPDSLLAARGIGDPEGEERWLTRLISAADGAARAEAKTRTLLKLLRRVREPAIVFTEYRDTLEHLQVMLRTGGILACALHGGLAPEERRSTLSTFAHGDHVLLATDTAAEGLNLQHRCRLVVHYELPWNPARMLQRAGRVDRLGQRRRVHETALVARDTAESLVLAPLVRRALRSRDTGPGQRMIELLSESRVAAMVFEGRVPDLLPPPPPPALTFLDYAHEAGIEAHRLLDERRLSPAQSAAPKGRSVLPVSMMRLHSFAPGLVLVFELRFTNVRSDVEHCEMVAIQLQTGTFRWRPSLADFRNRLAQTLPAFVAAARPAIVPLIQERMQRLQPSFETACRRMHQREEELQALDASAARRLVQKGLFERRGPLEPALPDAHNPRDGMVHRTVPGDVTLSARAELAAVLIAVPR